jgi:hypothetical protein
MRNKAAYLVLVIAGVVLLTAGTVMIFLDIEWGLLVALLGLPLIFSGGRELYRARDR